MACFSRFYLLFIITCVLQLNLFQIPCIESYEVKENRKSRRSKQIYDKIQDLIGYVPFPRPRCGGKLHSNNSRICFNNDTLCGFWDKRRYFHSLSCEYRDITPAMARKCLGNRTLAFIGDSQIRDISVGVAYLLLGRSLIESPEEKFDYKHKLETNATKINDFPHWKKNVPGHNYNGHIFPLPEIAKKYNYTWQVQTWSLYRYDFVEHQIDDILTHKTTQLNKLLHPVDLAFWSHGMSPGALRISSLVLCLICLLWRMVFVTFVLLDSSGPLISLSRVQNMKRVSWDVSYDLITTAICPSASLFLSSLPAILIELFSPFSLSSVGLHDWGWWHKHPRGESYFEQMVGKWLALRNKVPVPTVWVTMNPECKPKLLRGPSLFAHLQIQSEMVEEANWYTNRQTLIQKLPLWDAAAALRVPDRCNFSSDGLHVKMFVDIMRAKMLFNHLCDSKMKWRGGIKAFL